jgi:predicted amidohydrolase YtcJ
MTTLPTTVFAARRILTLNPAQPHASHVAVRDGRILAVGGPDVASPWGPAVEDRRFADRVLLPGFVEGHCHLAEGSVWRSAYLGWFDRRDPRGKLWPGLRSLQAVVERLQALDAAMTAEAMPDESPLIAWGFDPIYFGGERMTTRHLDTVGNGQRPIVIAHANGHLLNVNSRMLALAGIDADCEVEGVMRYPDGTPNGELQEPAAMHQVFRCVGPVGPLAPMSADSLRDFGTMACRAGITTATDLVNKLTASDVALLQAYAHDESSCRVRLLPAFQAFHGTHGAAAGAEHVRALLPQNHDRLRFGLVKMMLDGSIQGYSARIRWPGYVNGSPNGIWVTAPGQYEADFETYHRAGLTIHTHTNGDEASEAAIEAIERVLARAPRPGHRHTLQHGQMLDTALFRRMAATGLHANLFPNHLWVWGDQHHDHTIGPDRAHRMNACRSALRAGVPLAIHSDAPVTPLGPLFSVWCAVNRRTPSGRVLGAHERLTVQEALHAVTLGPAATLGLDHEIGSIEVGKRADFAVLAADPCEVPAEAVKDIAVQGTVLGGRWFAAQADGG